MKAAELYEFLNELPCNCDDFTVRFTTTDKTYSMGPEGWRCDDDGNLTLLYSFEDGNTMTVNDLKELLNGENNGRCESGNEVYDKTPVYIQHTEEDGDYYDYAYEPILRKIYINWKQKRAEVWME